jgi:hypothetical protein
MTAFPLEGIAVMALFLGEKYEDNKRKFKCLREAW